MRGHPKNQWWPILLTGTTNEEVDLNAVGGAEAGHIWAVGDEGTILFRGPSGAWSRFSSTGTGALSCVWSSAAQVVIGGAKTAGKNLLRWRDAEGQEPAHWWPHAVRSIRNITSIFGSGEEMFIGDDDGCLAMLTCDLERKDTVPLPISDRILGGAVTDLMMVVVFSEETFWRWRVPPPGQEGAAAEWGAWQRLSLSVETSTAPFARQLRFNAAWADPSGTVWLCGDHGAVARWTPSGWAVAASLGYRDLFSVHGCAPDDVWVAGEGGAIYRWNGTAWKLSSSKVSATLYGVWACPEVVLAVGEAQTILEFRRT